MSEIRWDWSGVDESRSIIVPRMQATAVYQNGARDIVVRQQDLMGGEDNVIVIQKKFAKEVIAAIQREYDLDTNPED